MVGVSACLLGFCCRFDGGNKKNDKLYKMFIEGEAFPVCPEVFGGLGVPRPPSYIEGGCGKDVWTGKAKVKTTDGRDVTEEFKKGAKLALHILKALGIRSVFLKEKSPSCGVLLTYSSGNTLVNGPGVFSTLLIENEFILKSF